MSHPSFLKLAAALAAGTLVALPAMAQSGPGLQGRYYVGGSIGKPDFRTDNLGGVTGGDTSGTGFKLYGGYAFTPYVSLELGGAHLGKLAGVGGDAKADAYFLDAVGTFPINPQWAVLGRIGVVNTHVSAPIGSDSGTDGKLGVGLQYNMDRNWSVRAEAEHYRTRVFDVKPHVNLYSVGVNYAF